MRAVAVRVSAQNTAGGFILPGDRVDVVQTVAQQTSADAPAENVSRTILTNIKVLAIDQTVDEEEGEAVVVGKTATLELDAGAGRARHRRARRPEPSRWRCAAWPTPTRSSARSEERQSGTVRIFRGGRSQSRPRRSEIAPMPRSNQMTALGRIRAIFADAAAGADRLRRRSTARGAQSPAYMKLTAGDMLARPARSISASTSRWSIDLPRAAGDVLVSNPQIADAVLRTSTAALPDRRAARPGQRLPVRQRRRADRQLRHLCRGRSQRAQPASRRGDPDGYVRAEAIQGSIVLRGQVASAADASRAVEIAQQHDRRAGRCRSTTGRPRRGTAGGSGTSTTQTLQRRSGPGIVNLLTITGEEQVALKVTIAEVQREVVEAARHQRRRELRGRRRVDRHSGSPARAAALSPIPFNAGGGQIGLRLPQRRHLDRRARCRRSTRRT